MNLCFNCGKSSPTQICEVCEEIGCFKNRPADPCSEEYQALKQATLEIQEAKEREYEGYSKGMSARAIRRNANKKPRKKIKKL